MKACESLALVFETWMKIVGTLKELFYTTSNLTLQSRVNWSKLVAMSERGFWLFKFKMKCILIR